MFTRATSVPRWARSVDSRRRRRARDADARDRRARPTRPIDRSTTTVRMRAMMTPRARARTTTTRETTTMGASGRNRIGAPIVGARRRPRAFSVGEDGKWSPGPFLRPEGSPPLESYNGPTVWRLMQEELVECGLEQITPTSAKAMCEENGWTLVDVRPESDYNARHCWGAINAQYYRAMDASDPKNWGKAALSAFIFPERVGGGYLNVTENEDFLDDLMEQVEWGSPLVLYDDVGGVIGEPGVNFENGVQTPSLMAIYELAARGWGVDNLMHMAGGLVFWDEVDGFDCGEVDESAEADEE